MTFGPLHVCRIAGGRFEKQRPQPSSLHLSALLSPVLRNGVSPLLLTSSCFGGCNDRQILHQAERNSNDCREYDMGYHSWTCAEKAMGRIKGHLRDRGKIRDSRRRRQTAPVPQVNNSKMDGPRPRCACKSVEQRRGPFAQKLRSPERSGTLTSRLLRGMPIVGGSMQQRVSVSFHARVVKTFSSISMQFPPAATLGDADDPSGICRVSIIDAIVSATAHFLTIAPGSASNSITAMTPCLHR